MWFKVTFLSPSWRSLNLWRGHLTIPKRSQRIARSRQSRYRKCSKPGFSRFRKCQWRRTWLNAITTKSISEKPTKGKPTRKIEGFVHLTPLCQDSQKPALFESTLNFNHHQFKQKHKKLQGFGNLRFVLLQQTTVGFANVINSYCMFFPNHLTEINKKNRPFFSDMPGTWMSWEAYERSCEEGETDVSHGVFGWRTSREIQGFFMWANFRGPVVGSMFFCSKTKYVYGTPVDSLCMDLLLIFFWFNGVSLIS